jgi:hypothetical protein
MRHHVPGSGAWWIGNTVADEMSLTRTDAVVLELRRMR